MTRKRVQAILSDYDGTLVPTADVKNVSTNAIPAKLEQILSNISAEIPVSVISTKDFEFLRKKTAFARALSCMMGIETLFMTNHATSRTIEKRILSADDLSALQLKSAALEAIAEEVIMCKEFSTMLVERKHTSDGILAGLTIDWRNQLGDDWSYYRRAINHFLSRIVSNLKKAPVPMGIYVQKYSEHPFVDIYGIECNKGVAFDTIISELRRYISIDNKGTLYLGDSENDNPAFRKAGISIGIRSDTRVNPKLDCSYFLDYERLSHFLMKLRKNNLIFTDELLMESERYG